MKFQGRGNVYLSVLDGNLVPGPVRYKLCTDAFAIKPKTETFSHINKCGPVDVEDARGTKSQAVDVTITLAEMEDRIAALGLFANENAAGSPGSVVDEVLPSGIQVGDYYFLGGKTRHRNITSLVIQDSASSPATLVLNTDYELEDAERGRVKFLTAGHVQPYVASYSHTDPADIAIFTAGQKEFVLDYEFINKQNANKKGSLELFRVRFDAADNIDFQSEELQLMTLNGSALADTSRDADDVLGQFGRRVL